MYYIVIQSYAFQQSLSSFRFISVRPQLFINQANQVDLLVDERKSTCLTQPYETTFENV